MIPLVDLPWQHQQIWPELEERIIGLMERGAFILGSEVEQFERAFASYSGTEHCIGVASGTDALELALRSLELPSGGEVIVPTNSFVASAAAVVRAGLSPVLADVDEETFLLDAKTAEAAVTDRTVAVMPVHLYGRLADMPAIADVAQRHHLRIVEDAAQSQGARTTAYGVGTFADVAATSFYPGKNLGAYGDGGAVLTNQSSVADRVRMLRDHGSAEKYHHELLGTNSRLDALQAAVLSAKLKRLDEWNALRINAAARYTELLAGAAIDCPELITDGSHVWHLFVVRVADRDGVVDRLQREGIGVGIHYPVPIHHQPALRDHLSGELSLPVAESLAREILSLPLFPGITSEQQEQVVTALNVSLQG